MSKKNKNRKYRAERKRSNNPTLYTHLIFKFRLKVLVGIVILLFTGLIYNLYCIQIRDHNKYTTHSIKNYIKITPISPERGLITDRNGIIVAQNIIYYGLYSNPVNQKTIEHTISTLKERKLLDISEEDYQLYKKASITGPRFSPVLLKGYLNKDDIARVLVHSNEYSHLSVGTFYKRYYPYANELTHLLGYVSARNDKDNAFIQKQENGTLNYTATTQIGKIGIERFYEPMLHGTLGYNKIEVNARGLIIKNLETVDAIPGKNLRLSIDLPTQIFASRIIRESEDKKAVIILSDVETSEIIAMVSEPSYDANLFTDRVSSKDFKVLLEDPNRPLYNRATMGIYPPASTVKPFVAAAGLESGFITPDFTIEDPGYWIVPNSRQKYRDWKWGGHGIVDLKKSIAESVDTYYYDLAYRMGIIKLESYLSKFGFGHKTGIDIYEESSANLPTPDWKKARKQIPWLDGDTPPVGIGQGYFTSTPIQMNNALNILVNNGIARTPHLLLNSYDNDEAIDSIHPIAEYKPVPKEHLLSSPLISLQNTIKPVSLEEMPAYQAFTFTVNSHWKDIKAGMLEVTQSKHGSAHKVFEDFDIKVGGKTGTAQVFGLNGSSYNSKKLDKNLHDHALFIGYAPYDKPKVSITVIVENGGGGSKTAAPIARKVLDYYFNQRLELLKGKDAKEQLELSLEALNELGVTLAPVNKHGLVYDNKELSRSYLQK